MKKTLADLNNYFKPRFIEITSEYNTHFFNMDNDDDIRAFEYFKKYVAIFYSYCEEKLNVSI
jgi:hypothetical protein